MRPVVPLTCALLAGACAAGDEPARMSTLPAATAAPVPAASVPTPSGRPRIVMLGDSLTAGYGLESDQSYPALLQDRLDAAGYAYDVVNAGVSGDTSAGGLRRLDWSLDGDVHLLVVALGGNDGLRGLPVTQLEDNLSAIIEQGREAGATVVLAGMEAPPNYGPEYTGSFRQVYRDLAREYDVTLIPFLLDGVAGVPSLNLPDGIHPNPEGARKVEALVWTAIEPHLERVEP